MRLWQKLTLFLLAAAVLPLAGAGFWLLKVSEAEVLLRIDRELDATAAAAAEAVGAQLNGALNAAAASCAAIDWLRATPEERLGALRLLTSQSPLIALALFVEAPSAPPLAAAGAALSQAQALHLGPALLGALPLEALASRGEQGQVALAPALGFGEGAVLPVALQLGPRGSSSPFVVLGLSLEGLRPALAARATAPELRLELLDGDERLVARATEGAGLPEALPLARRAAPGARLSPSDERLALAVVPERLGLSARASVPQAIALAPVRALRRTALAGAGLTLTLLVAAGLLFVAALNRRLTSVGQAALAYARGELSTRLDASGTDELAELADTFNRMGTELEGARGRLTRWNDELKLRVDEATAELRAAQAQLVEAQKLAAIGQLGAGVAHEINNPLCGILGSAQLLMLERASDDPDFELLRNIEESARRCRDITSNLLRFSQSFGAGQPRTVDLNAVARSALALDAQSFAQAQVSVEARLAEGALEAYGDPDQLAQVLLGLFSNARTAMLKVAAKHLTLTTEDTPQGPRVTVRDTGKGIAPEHLTRIFEPFFSTKDVWSNVGLGLSIAYRVVSEHGGRLEVHSEVGKGATFVLQLPVAQQAPRSAPVPALRPPGGEGLGVTG